MGSFLGTQITMLVFLFQFISLPKSIKSDTEHDKSVWDRIETICPSQSCKYADSSNLTRWCSCDSSCVKFHDCCFDKVVESKDVLEEEHMIRLREERVQCTRSSFLGWSMLVSSCPNDTNSPSTDSNWRLCTEASHVSSYMLDIPITSSLTGLTYRNVHCAVCNGDARNLVPRRAVLKLNAVRGSSATNTSDWVYQNGSLYWKHTLRSKPTEHELKTAGLEDSYGYVLFNQMEYGSGESTESSELVEEPRDVLVIKDGRTNIQSFQNLNVLVAGDSSEVSEELWDGTKEDSELKDMLKELILSDRDVEDGWKLNFSRKHGDEIEMTGENERSEDIVNVELGKNSWLFVDEEFIRRCPAGSMVAACNRTRMSEAEDIAVRCHSYLMPVYTLRGRDGKMKVFRNPHCAICNNVAAASLRCFSHPFRENKVGTNEVTEGVVHLMFSFGDALTGDRRCGSRSVWDPLLKKCYFLDGGLEMGPKESKKMDEEMAVTETQKAEVEVERLGSRENAEDDYCKDSTLLTMSKVQWYLASAFFGVSVVCLCLHVFIHACAREQTETPPNNLEKRQPPLNPIEMKHSTDRSFHILAWLLVLGQILFIAGSRRSEMRVVCIAIAVAHNFLSLAAISWLSVFCLQVFQSFFSIKSLKSVNSVGSEPERPSLKLTLTAWIVPTIFSSLCLTLELVPGNLRSCLARGGACWYGDTVSFRILFILPALLMLAGDGCIFTAIIFGIREKRGGNSAARSKNDISRRRSSNIAYNDHRRFRLCARLGLLMSISWSCAAIASLGGLTSLWYGFVIFSGLQGVFIFVSSGAKSKLTHIIWVKATGKPLTIEVENRSRKKNVKSDTSEIPTVSVQK